jgi:hypothetical protein
MAWMDCRRLVSRCGGRSSSQSQSILDLWWINWHWQKFFFEFFCFTLLKLFTGAVYSYITWGLNNRPVGGRSSETVDAIDINNSNMIHQSWRVWSVLQNYLCKSRWNKILKFLQKSKVNVTTSLRRLKADFCQTHQHRTDLVASDTRLHCRHHYSLVCTFWYQILHRQNLLEFVSASHERRSRTVKCDGHWLLCTGYNTSTVYRYIKLCLEKWFKLHVQELQICAAN